MTGHQHPLRFAIAILASAIFLACSGSQPSGGDGGLPDSGGLPDAGVADGGADAGVDGGLDAGVDGGPDAGGAGRPDGGPSPVDGGVTATAFTSGGGVSSSAHYVLIGTVGQGPSSNAATQSTNYQLRGGLVGATQNP